MMNAYYDAAKKAGVKILYEAEVVDFEIADGEFRSASVIIEGKPAKVNAKYFDRRLRRIRIEHPSG